MLSFLITFILYNNIMEASCKVLFVALLLYSCNICNVHADFETDMKYIHVCNKTSPISMRMMNEVLISKTLPSSEVDLGNFKCFLYCLFKHYGWMDEIGGFELHNMRRILAETGSIHTSVMNFIMYRCTALEEMNKCERAFQFLQCFWEKTSNDNKPEEGDENEKFFYALEDQGNNMFIR